jgi:hypothetical protein
VFMGLHSVLPERAWDAILRTSFPSPR